MKPRLSDLWSWKGTIERGPYVFWGISLALLKYNLDRILVGAITGRALRPFDYWVPGDLLGVLPASPEGRRAALWLLVTCLPFVWSGIVLTLRRIRAVGMPSGTILLFFVPVLNVLLFAALSAMSTRADEETRPAHARARLFDRVVPESRVGSAAMAIAIVVPLTAALAYVSATLLGEYGWGLFVGLPFFLGLASALIHGYHEPRPLSASIAVALLSCALLAGVLCVLAIEGVICILMATPIALTLAILGAIIGHTIQRRLEGGRDAGPIVGSFVLLLPAIFGAEQLAGSGPPLIEVETVVEIDAPPERVWEHVVAFAELPPPTERLFRLGVAYPLRAEIRGEGVGAVRHCVFSTGSFVEPIEVWDESRRLEFSVSAQPPSMRELSPYPQLAPPHLERYLVSHRGRFVLEPLPGGRTRLAGTTWYTNRMWPQRYWQVFSDGIVHAIHRRVLEHIRTRAEQRT